MVPLNELVNYLNRLLSVEKYQDYGPNGLQLRGGDFVGRLITGVSISQDLIEVAIDKNADTIMVHHGLWRYKDSLPPSEITKKRLSRLLEKNLTLLAYHFPLDFHPDFGNNVELARLLSLERFYPEISPDNSGSNQFYFGKFAQPLSGLQLAARLKKQLGRDPLYLSGMGNTISTVAIMTGGAQRMISKVPEGIDAFITGEVSEETVLNARESGLHFYAAGHHATERYGVRSLGEHLAKNFDISTSFVDIENPV